VSRHALAARRRQRTPLSEPWTCSPWRRRSRSIRRSNRGDHRAGHLGVGKGAGQHAGKGPSPRAYRQWPARLCAAEKRSSAGPRAQRASFIW